MTTSPAIPSSAGSRSTAIKTREIRGVICPLVTPFQRDGSLDEVNLRRHVSFQIAAGVDAIMVTGGCGEFFALDDEERVRAAEAAVAEANGRVPVIVGLLAPGTAEVARLALRMRPIGADAIMVLPPYYVTPSRAGVEDHFRRIAGAAETSIVLYNNPRRTGVNLDTPMLDHLAGLPGVVAVKDCDRDLCSIAEKIDHLAGRIAFLSGDDDLGCHSLRLGAVGGVWALVNLLPKLFVKMSRAVRNNRVAEAESIHRKLLPLIRAVLIENHPGPLKELLLEAGRPVGTGRPPLQPMTPLQRRNASGALARLMGRSAPSGRKRR